MFRQFLFIILVMGITDPAFGESLDNDFMAGREVYQAGDYKRAFTLFKDCAEKGHCGCMNSLANCYLEGRGVEKNVNHAIEWYMSAYETGAKCGPAGLYSALYLARIYVKGQGVVRDPLRARMWCKKALALLDDPKLANRLGSKGTENFRKRIKKMLSTLK